MARVVLTREGQGGNSSPLLANGHYQLLLDTSLIYNGAGQPLEDTDGTRDGIIRLDIHQLAGDTNGDGQLSQDEIEPLDAVFEML